jgi:hypothetical protein
MEMRIQETKIKYFIKIKTNRILVSITLSSRFILCATLHLRRLAPTNVVVGIIKGEEYPCPLVAITVRGFSSPSSVSSSSSNGIC